MKIVRLTLAMLTTALLMASPFCVYGQEAKFQAVAPPERVQPPAQALQIEQPMLAPSQAQAQPQAQQRPQADNGQNQRPCNPCNQCNQQCCNGCVAGTYGYGQAVACQPDRQKGPCPIHGCAPCAGPGQAFGGAFRQILAPADRPLLGMQPVYPNGRMQGMYAPVPPGYGYGGPGVYGPNGIAGCGGYGIYGRDMAPAPGMNGQWGLIDRPKPKHDPRFPILRSILCPEPFYMTTSPAPPMPTYQTRGPRDFFLDPNVAKFGDIGY